MRRIRFRLRSLLLVMLVLCAVLAFGRWLVTAKYYYTVVEAYPDGTPMHRFSLARDLWGEVYLAGKQVSYYPNGSPCSEYTVKLYPRDHLGKLYYRNGRVPSYMHYPGTNSLPTRYLPSGTQCSELQFLNYVHQRKLEVDEKTLAAWIQPGKKLLWLNDRTVHAGDTELGFLNLPSGETRSIDVGDSTKGVGYEPGAQNFYIPRRFSIREYCLSKRTITPSGRGFVMHGAAIDPIKCQMYWAEHQGNVIARANLDGTKRATVLQTKEHPSNVALDLTNRRIYFSAGNQIHRANLDGTSVEALNRGNINGIAVDAVGGRIYWTDRSAGRVMTAALDGSDETLVIYKKLSEGICLDTEAQHVYFSAEHPSKIFRCDFDGKNLRIIRALDRVNTLKLVAID